MQRLSVLVLLLSSMALAAKTRDWKDVLIIGINSEMDNRGIAAVPIGGAIAAVPIRRLNTWIRLESDDMSYVLFVKQQKHPLNLTIHGKAKLATDGYTAYLLDDSGKELKLPIVRKVAK